MNLALSGWTLLHWLPLNLRAEEPTLEELRARVEKLEKQQEAGASSATSAEDPDKKKEEASREYVVGSDMSFKPVWRDGLVFETPNKDFRFSVGGKVRQDWGFGTSDPALEDTLGQIQDGANFRSLRLGAAGTFYEIMN